MAFVPGDLAEITMEMRWQAQVVVNVFQYQLVTVAGSPNGANIAEAWWNHVKVVYRALVPAVSGNTFVRVLCRELNDPTGEFGEFTVPAGESPGTRPVGALTVFMPSFTATGVRFAVASRITRPGQKRLPFMFEEDSNGQTIVAGWSTLVQAWAAVLVANMVLGVPAAATELNPIVTRKDTDGSVLAHQPVVGYLVNGNTTTQVSRKIGRGA